MNFAENYWSHQSSSIYTPSHQRIQVQNVIGAKEILVQLGISISNHSIVYEFRKCFEKFMIPKAFFKKCLSEC